MLTPRFGGLVFCFYLFLVLTLPLPLSGGSAVSDFTIVQSHHERPDLPSARLRPLPLPEQLPGGAIRVRNGETCDLPFIDALQRKHSKAVGWMPTAQLEGHLAKRHVVVAETTDIHPVLVGYCIGVDRYFKREDVGIIYQMNIDPKRQRGVSRCDAAEIDVRTQRVWSSAVLLLVRPRPVGEPVLGSDGVRTPGLPIWEPTQREDTHLLAEAYPGWRRRRPGDERDAMVVPEPDRIRGVAGRSDRAADPAGGSLVGGEAQGVAGDGSPFHRDRG